LISGEATIQSAIANALRFKMGALVTPKDSWANGLIIRIA
jgi:hypothetical protein